MKTKIGTEVAHVTRDSDTTTCMGAGHIVAASRTACLLLFITGGYTLS